MDKRITSVSMAKGTKSIVGIEYIFCIQEEETRFNRSCCKRLRGWLRPREASSIALQWCTIACKSTLQRNSKNTPSNWESTFILLSYMWFPLIAKGAKRPLFVGFPQEWVSRVYLCYCCVNDCLLQNCLYI